jgi:hypothetical protein
MVLLGVGELPLRRRGTKKELAIVDLCYLKACSAISPCLRGIARLTVSEA